MATSMSFRPCRLPGIIIGMTLMPSLVLCSGAFDWIERPLNSFWRPRPNKQQQQETPQTQGPPAHHETSSRITHLDGDLEMETIEILPAEYTTDERQEQNAGASYEGDGDDPRASLQFTSSSTSYPLIESPEEYDEQELEYQMYDSDDEDDFYGDEGDIAAGRNGNGSPFLVYRFYAGKSTLSSRTTRYSPTAIPFLCIGPNVDHWKPVATELASRGFNVIACERVLDDPPQEIHSKQQSAAHDYAKMIRKLLDALRWSHVVLVGCDLESLVAIQAAIQLAPHRVVGLALCGNLDFATRQLMEEQDRVLLQQQHQRHHDDIYSLTTKAAAVSSRNFSPSDLDRFLFETVKCPFRIISDGNGGCPPWALTSKHSAALPSGSRPASSSSNMHRCQIIGGGSAPHRRRPEQFAWILSRFVEEQVAPIDAVGNMVATPRARGGQQLGFPSEFPSENDEPRNHASWRADFRDKLLSPFSFTVGGRLVATAIFYTICLKVAIYQFENFRIGVNTIVSARQRVTRALSFIFPWITLTRERETAICLSDNDDDNSTYSKIRANDDFGDMPDGDVDIGGEERGKIERHDAEKARPDDGQFRPSFFLDNVIA